MATLASDLLGLVGLALAQAVEQLPGERALTGGCRYELKWDGWPGRGGLPWRPGAVVVAQRQ